MEKLSSSEAKKAQSETDIITLPADMDLWDELEQLGEEIGANWLLDIDSVALITLLRDEES